MTRKAPRFSLGKIMTTPAAIDLLDRAGVNANDLLTRHQKCDWGMIQAADAVANTRALRKGERLRSAYELGDHKELLWVETSADRTTTTLLLPRESPDLNRTHLLQRFHPALKIGATLSSSATDGGMPVHCRQGVWDSACGPHCVAMAMAILGELADPTELAEHGNGVGARLWKAAKTTYFGGTNIGELARMIVSLQTRYTVSHVQGPHSKCITFAHMHVENGQLVIASWRNRPDREHHWVLIVGSEGIQTASTFTPHALLALDPGVDEPLLCGYNARLELASRSGPRHNTPTRYVTLDGMERKVKLTSALTLNVPVHAFDT
jgi:hypothetical protein